MPLLYEYNQWHSLQYPLHSETECHIRSVNIIVNSLWQRNNIQTFFAEQIRCLLSPIAAKDHKAVKLQIAISCLHRLNLVKAILTRHPHQLKGCLDEPRIVPPFVRIPEKSFGFIKI